MQEYSNNLALATTDRENVAELSLTKYKTKTHSSIHYHDNDDNHKLFMLPSE